MKIITNALSARRPDWKRKRDVMVTPPRKPGETNPVLRASIERTFDTFGMDGEPNSTPLNGWKKFCAAWVLAPRSIKSGRYSRKNNRPRAVARRAVTGFHSGSRAKLPTYESIGSGAEIQN